MQLADSEQKYGLVTRVLHWAIAGLILWQFVGMGLRALLGRHPVASFFVGGHQTIGFVILGLVALRIVWALVNSGRRPPHGAGLLGLAARAGHFALYALMFSVPALALLRAWGGTRGFAPWGVQIFAPRAEEAQIGWAVEANLLHGELAWVLGALILGHIFMVGVHEGLLRDGTLGRMLGRPRR